MDYLLLNGLRVEDYWIRLGIYGENGGDCSDGGMGVRPLPLHPCECLITIVLQLSRYKKRDHMIPLKNFLSLSSASTPIDTCTSFGLRASSFSNAATVLSMSSCFTVWPNASK